jgi:DNA-binding winged helix-turn-helix (wHTH) protein
VSRVSFGDFVLDLDSRELLRGPQALPLTPKAYQLLEILVTNRPKALSKFALQERLWPGAFVVEKNLVNLIAEIRKSLGDDPTHPRFVRTIHRYGYAFQLPPVETPAGKTTSHQTAVRFRLLWAYGRAGLGEGEHVLGRDPDLELFFDSPGVSRRHALIRVAGETATVEDLNSKNGTFVADRSLDSPTQLHDGDRIRIGSVQLTFSAIRTAASTRTERAGKSRGPKLVRT